MTVDPPAPVDPEKLRRLLEEADKPRRWEGWDGDIWRDAQGRWHTSVAHSGAEALVAMHAALPAALTEIETLREVALKAMALTDVWSSAGHDFNSDFATVSLMELEELEAAVEPFRHTTLNPLHDPADCEACSGSDPVREEP